MILRRAAVALFASTLCCPVLGRAAPPASADASADAATSAAPEPPNYIRPAVEIGAGLAAASLWYFVDERNVLDWDEPSMKERLNGDAWRFDNNTFALNYVWHPLAGSGMYVLARGNRVGVWPSFLYSLAGSTAWEYLIEFNEKVSINDMAVTPLAGLAAGEFMHKLAQYVSEAPHAPADHALAWTLGLSVHGHRRLDRLPPAPSRLWHDLAVTYGFGLTEGESQRARGAHLVGFEGRFVSLEQYRARADLARWFCDADVASLEAELDVADSGVGIELFAETVLAGFHYQQLAGSRRRPSGFAVTSGVGVAYGYRSTEAFGYDDRQGLLHLPGLVTELFSAGGSMRATALVRAYPTFGSMSSRAFPEWRDANPGARTKTVLERANYFYGWGWNTGAELRLGLGDLELSAALRYGRLASIEGLDRSQERLSEDVQLSESALEYEGAAWVKMSRSPLKWGLSYERHSRASHAGNIEEAGAGAGAGVATGHRLLMKVAHSL